MKHSSNSTESNMEMITKTKKKKSSRISAKTFLATSERSPLSNWNFI